jgi:F0F1-type ATP synthase assembly protein I
MVSQKTPAHDVGAGNSHLALGFTFAAGVIFFLGIGLLVDRRFGFTPVFTVIGAIGGAVLSFLNVYWKLEAETARRREKKRDR